jgi:putative ABC transport system substrate-binding protein
MRRREFVTLLGGAAAAGPVAAGAQQRPAMPVIGYLGWRTEAGDASNVEAFRQGLRESGFIVGQNVAIEFRWADGQNNRLPALAADLVRRRVNVLVCAGGPAVPVAKAATSTIPIVFSTGDDPIERGLVASLNRPGGNLTGISMSEQAMANKQIEMLHEIVPKAEVMGVIVNPTNPFYESVLAGLQAAARVLKIHLSVVRVTTAQEIDEAFASTSRQGAGAVVILGDPLFQDRRDQLVALQNHYSLPTVFSGPEFPRLGGLMGYGANVTSVFHDLGTYTGRILKGVRPEDLPAEQTTKFAMVINLTTAKALGLTIPQSLLLRADEVIE